MVHAMSSRRQHGIHGLSSARTIVLAASKLLFLGFRSVSAAPLQLFDLHDDEPEAEGPSLILLYIVSVILVLLGGAFAGLTIAYMGQDSIYLRVVAGDPFEPQSKNARRVYNLLTKGKHWVLVALLLSNVIVNETLPVVLDRCFGGGVPAVVGSTILIVIFGEILPQSVCVRYGLQIGAIMSKPVLALMWLLAPVAWPIAKLLDWVLGEDHGTVYKKSGLKGLVSLHKSLGEVSERLTEDEVTIISAVLDLKDKPVGDVMTPIDDVFVMSEDTVLDEETMDRILSQGYSRIPIHTPGRPRDFVGMLLVKILITYDPEDGSLVRDFPLATLPETRPETSCLDIVNFFQEGKSHMVVVSETPGEDHGALGVVTLEDVIEELIGEEIIDESDVYIDVHKAIRRLAPAPKARPSRRNTDSSISPDPTALKPNGSDPLTARAAGQGGDTTALSTSPKTMTMLRRTPTGDENILDRPVEPFRANFEDIRQHLRHLGPSNRATNPKNTKSTTVKIKLPVAGGAHPATAGEHDPSPLMVVTNVSDTEDADADPDESMPLLRPVVSGKGGTSAVRKSYGSAHGSEAQRRLSGVGLTADGEGAHVTTADIPIPVPAAVGTPDDDADKTPRAVSSESIPGLHDLQRNPSGKRRTTALSGSITESIVEAGGVRKIVIHASSGEENDEGRQSPGGPQSPASSRSDSKKVEPLADAAKHSADEEDSQEPDGDESGPSQMEVLSPTSTTDDNTAAASSGGGGSGASKKKNRRKKRKGGGTKF